PTFALPATPFLASSLPEPNDEQQKAAAAALFGAPLDLTESFRSGAAQGPTAVRYMSESLESYSPVLDRDLGDVSLLDCGDVELHDTTDVATAIQRISDAAASAAQRGRLAIMLGG